MSSVPPTVSVSNVARKSSNAKQLREDVDALMKRSEDVNSRLDAIEENLQVLIQNNIEAASAPVNASTRTCQKIGKDNIQSVRKKKK